jgi:hypothetical protein
MFWGFRNKMNYMRAALAICVLLSAGSCCEKSELELSRVDDFMASVGKLSANGSIYWAPLAAGQASVVVSLESWSNMVWFDAARFGFDIQANAEFEMLTASMDVDNDAVKEKVYRLQITNPDSTAMPVFFYRWSGDRYTLDENRTYLGWVSGGTSHLVISANQSTSGGVVCVAPVNAPVSFECSPCTNSYRCGACDDDGSLSSCVSAGESGNFTTTAVTFLDSDSGTLSGTDPDSGTETSSLSGTDTMSVADTDSNTASDSSDHGDTGNDTASDSQRDTGGTDTGSGITVDLDSDSQSDITIVVDSDTFSIHIDSEIGIDTNFGFGF